MKLWLALCAFLLCQTVEAQAASFPERPVRIIVPNPAGGSNDLAARTLAQALTAIWPHAAVVENYPGGGGNIGAQNVAASTPDGYTYLLSSPGPITINPSLYRKLPFNPSSFIPIALVATVPIVLMVNPKVPVQSVSDLIDLAKKSDGKLNYASTGVGSAHHLATELFQKLADVKLVHIPYRGAAPAMNDLIGGHVPMLFDNLSTVIPQVRSGNVRAVAVASAQRLSQLPEVPTFAESGLPDFEVSSWFGLLAPAGTPPDIVAKMIADVEKVMANPDLQKKLVEAGTPPGKISGAAFGRFMKEETEKWAGVIKSASVPILD